MFIGLLVFMCDYKSFFPFLRPPLAMGGQGHSYRLFERCRPDAAAVTLTFGGTLCDRSPLQWRCCADRSVLCMLASGCGCRARPNLNLLLRWLCAETARPICPSCAAYQQCRQQSVWTPTEYDPGTGACARAFSFSLHGRAPISALFTLLLSLSTFLTPQSGIQSVATTAGNLAMGPLSQAGMSASQSIDWLSGAPPAGILNMAEGRGRRCHVYVYVSGLSGALRLFLHRIC